MDEKRFTLVYCTNISSHYQASICLEFARKLGEGHFKMCLFGPLPEERRQLDWGEAPEYEWIVKPPQCDQDLEVLRNTVCDAGVAVMDDYPYLVRAARVVIGKLTFLTSERLWKKPFYWWRMLNPGFARGVNWVRAIFNRPNIHYPPMGRFVGEDLQLINAFGDRIWTSAYFADVASEALGPGSGGLLNILCVRRRLDWKRVDLLFRAISEARDHSSFDRLEIVGFGSHKDALEKLAVRLRLDGKCIFREPMNAEQVRELMRQADIYVLSSNRNKGWGVVANETISQGADLVANEQAGASRVLIDHGRAGFRFWDKNPQALAWSLQTLLDEPNLGETVRQKAWIKFRDLWHPRVGAKRLLELCRGLLGMSRIPDFQESPCSRLSLRA